MSVLQMLKERSNSNCELCTSNVDTRQYNIPPSLNETVDTCLMVCANCYDQIEKNTEMDVNHWRCLNDSMWSEHVAVQNYGLENVTTIKRRRVGQKICWT